MPVFAFEAVDNNGQKVRSDVTANSKDDAIKQIRQKGLRPTRIDQKKSETAPAAAGAAGPKKKKGMTLFDRVTPAQVTTFTTQLTTPQTP